MQKISILIVIIFFNISAIASEWNIVDMDYYTNVPLVDRIVKIRTGHLKANPMVPFKGDILYLQGLGDSMMNHAPLFNKLTDAGYRVIAFDYMGQGGSEGTMNHTRIHASIYEELNVQSIAEEVRKIHQRGDEKLIILGWSTGGLAGYKLARFNTIKAAILLAPGICPRVSVGTGALRGNKITIETLTSAASEYEFGGSSNPHLDPIKPTSPLLVPAFSSNLLYTGKLSKHWKISPEVKGMVLLGSEDKYVKTECIKGVINKNAPEFIVKEYKNGYHELDNETFSIRTQVHKDILNFLESL